MKTTDVRSVKSLVMAPNANACADSWIATARRECLDYFAGFSLKHADHLARAFARYHSQHRPHQGLGNQILNQPITPKLKLAQEERNADSIDFQSEMGGLLESYYRRAA